MTGVQTHTGGVREHIQHIILGLGEIPHIRPEGLVVLPIFMPFGFNGRMFVIHR
jgi:hypothetical protein